MDVIDELAEMGVFGLTIPEEYGGLRTIQSFDVRCLVRNFHVGYIGVGSLGTRTEIAAELIIAGGTEETKTKMASCAGLC